jgi:hypothetical protein
MEMPIITRVPEASYTAKAIVELAAGTVELT